MDTMSDLMMWNLIVGFLSATFVLPVVQQPHWSSAQRAAVTFAYSVLTGAVVAYLTGAFAHLNDAQAVISSVLTTLVTAIATYKGFAQPTGVAAAIESATSPGGTVTDGQAGA
jgi:cation transport ATPase